MNIVLLSHTFLPVVGGRELVVHHLALWLHRLGHDVRVVVPGGWWKNRRYRSEYRVTRYPNVVKGRLRAKTWRSWIREKEMLSQISLDLKRGGADVIHAHTTYPSGYLAALARAAIPSAPPLIITPHGADINVIPSIGHGLRMDPQIREKIDHALTDCDRVTAISLGMEKTLVGALHEAGVCREKIVRVPNGVDVSRFNLDRVSAGTRIRQKFPIPYWARPVVTVGNYHERKGHEVVIEAMARVVEVEPRAFLVIVGRGTDVLEGLIQEFSVSDHVLLAGAIGQPRFPQAPGAEPDDSLADILVAAEVYVAAGIEQSAEGMSLAVLEAMAAGLPIVATDISGNRDLVENAQHGYVVPPKDVSAMADGILGILGDQEARSVMSGLARQRASEYAWEGVARRYLEVYEDAISGVREPALVEEAEQ